MIIVRSAGNFTVLFYMNLQFEGLVQHLEQMKTSAFRSQQTFSVTCLPAVCKEQTLFSPRCNNI